MLCCGLFMRPSWLWVQAVTHPGCCCGTTAPTCTAPPRTPPGGCTLAAAETWAGGWTPHWWRPEHKRTQNSGWSTQCSPLTVLINKRAKTVLKSFKRKSFWINKFLSKCRFTSFITPQQMIFKYPIKIFALFHHFLTFYDQTTDWLTQGNPSHLWTRFHILYFFCLCFF